MLAGSLGKIFVDASFEQRRRTITGGNIPPVI
jgi:hypothetical protein